MEKSKVIAYKLAEEYLDNMYQSYAKYSSLCAFQDYVNYHRIVPVEAYEYYFIQKNIPYIKDYVCDYEKASEFIVKKFQIDNGEIDLSQIKI